MVKFGLKLWSTNTELADRSEELYRKGIFDYLELFVVPGSYCKCIEYWQRSSFPIILHAPHSYTGLNLSLRENEVSNRLLIDQINSFYQVLRPVKVIFHSGICGSIDETIRQIMIFKSEFQALFEIVLLENKPRIGLNGELCVGSSPEELEVVTRTSGVGCCLDIGHAISYAAWANMDYEDVIDRFLELKPDIFHLSDGNVGSERDAHLNFGKGNFDLNWIIKKIPLDAYISIETEKDLSAGLNDFEKDVQYLRDEYDR